MTRFTKTPTGTIIDATTGLEWAAESAGAMNWQAAMDYCAGLGDGWRAPTIREVQSTVDYGRSNPACDPIFGARSLYHWSSTTYRDSPGFAWVVPFGNGGTGANLKTGGGYVRAVRAGSRSFDDSTVVDSDTLTSGKLAAALEAAAAVLRGRDGL
jgi:hypothetical protein